ncbi:MAG: hypothetical protein U5Q03_20385 [Bacteroidota bacterium]|nr:hypothetical protein [Bacteroidota bacterium]
MNKRTRSVLLWILSVILMGGFAIYQRMTGPTYPLSGSIELHGSEVDYHFPRSQDSDKDAIVELETTDSQMHGTFHYRRYRSHDKWASKPMEWLDGKLTAIIPQQPPAGKVMYKIDLEKDGKIMKITEEPVIIRFKGSVPDYVLIPHIFFMFFAMVFSIRTGIEALVRGKYTYQYTIATVVLFFAGG